ncbi:MAG: c-type cytochrome [Candidatus Nanopelagicales bacterium]|nr:c-type cytochrome [Candidatus Nanopelagicales bacterium]
MKFLAARRRQPVVALAMLLFALVAVGGGYAAVGTVRPAEAAGAASSQTQVEMGKQLYLQGCSSCHSLQSQGSTRAPTLIGVGAAAVDFQVSTGRMPLAAPGVQAVPGPRQYNEEQTAALAAYIASLAPGPAIPNAEQVDFASADVAEGGVLFRVNCQQCHQAAGQGGALTQGKYAPSLMDSTPTQMYEAMITGPESMPIFSDATLPEENKKAIMAYVDYLQNASDPGGLSLGRLGPVTEGLFLWTAVFGALIAVAVWIGIKAR